MISRAETSSTVYEFDGSILISTLKADRTMNFQDALENAEARKKMNLPKDILFIMDIRALNDMSIEAIIATANAKDLEDFKAAALVVSTTMGELIAREGKRFGQGRVPTKVFHDISEARLWLKGQRAR